MGLQLPRHALPCLYASDKIPIWCLSVADKIQEIPIPGKVESEGYPPNLLIMDAPMAVHLPKLFTW